VEGYCQHCGFESKEKEARSEDSADRQRDTAEKTELAPRALTSSKKNATKKHWTD
jgi:hypothetical protein